jgi:DNA-binding MarR family transcriptional regulator
VADPLSSEALGAWRAFLTAHGRVTRRINRDLAEAGLPDLGWYDVLWALYEAPDRRLRMRDLAERVVVSRTGLVRLVDRIERAGLARREAVPGDRRGAYVAITDEGAALLRRMWPVYRRGVAEHFAAHLGARAGPLRRMLERVAESAGP